MKSACLAVLVSAMIAVAPAFARSVTDQDASNSPEMAAFRNGAFAEALTGWMREAEAGDGRAARYVGVLFDTGEGVARNQGEALSWYRRGAELGDVPAMFNVAVCLDAGRGTHRDPVEAARWYRRAATYHFGRAEYDLALMLQDGDGVSRDPQAAAAMFRSAYRDGILAARTHLFGRLRGHGDGAPAMPEVRPPHGSDMPETVFASAQTALLARSRGAATRAASLFARAAEQGGPVAAMARYDLAWCYENGIGVPADRQRAYRIFVQVAAETVDPALGNLAQAAAADAASLRVTVSTATLPVAAGR